MEGETQLGERGMEESQGAPAKFLAECSPISDLADNAHCSVDIQNPEK